MKQIDLKFFGIDSITDSLQRAGEYLSKHSDTTLLLPRGSFVVGTEFSRKLMRDVLTGGLGAQAQDRLFQPYFPYDTILKLENTEKINIIGNDTRLMIDGFLQPIGIYHSKEVTLSGVTIDYLRKPYSIGTAINVTKHYVDIRFEETEELNEKACIPRIIYYDTENDCFSEQCMEPIRQEKISEHTLRFYATHGLKDCLGKKMIAIHTYHYRPAIYIQDSVDIKLLHMTILSSNGMGILGHRSQDVTISHLTIMPSTGMPLSTNTDGMHFASCKGNIQVSDSLLYGCEDDMINVHNYYYTISEEDDSIYNLSYTGPDFIHAQIVDYPDVGDTLLLVNQKSLQIKGRCNVLTCAVDQNKLCAKVKLNRRLSKEEVRECLLFNETRQASLFFVRNTVKCGLSRGVMVKSKTAIIRDCTFMSTTGTAIHIAPEEQWKEGGGTEKVIIENNRFYHTGFGDYSIHGNASCICVEADCQVKDQKIHKEVVIHNNSFSKIDVRKHVIAIANTEQINLSDNYLL